MERGVKNAQVQKDPLEGPSTIGLDVKAVTKVKRKATMMRPKPKVTVTSTRPETKRREGNRQL